MKDRRRGGSYPSWLPSTIDFDGGKKWGEFSLDEDGTRYLTREAVGDSWRLSSVASGEAYEQAHMLAKGEILVLTKYLRSISLSYSRGFGILDEVTFKVTELVEEATAGEVAAEENWQVVEQLKERKLEMVATIFNVKDQPRLVLSVISIEGMEPKIMGVVSETIAPSDIGSLAGAADYNWKSHCSIFDGQVGIEIEAGSVVIYFENLKGKKYEYYRVRREVPEVGRFDRLVANRIPKKAEIAEFEKAIFIKK